MFGQSLLCSDLIKTIIFKENEIYLRQPKYDFVFCTPTYLHRVLLSPPIYSFLALFTTLVQSNYALNSSSEAQRGSVLK